MRPVRALVIYIVVIFIGGGLLAPWLWHLAQLSAPWFPRFAQAPFHRFLDRSFLILALAGVWPMRSALGTTSLRELGVVPPYGQGKKFCGGLLLGFLSLALVAALALGFGGRIIAPSLTAHQWVGAVFSAIGTAAMVATLEEILFRGGIFGGLRQVLYWPFALAISSVVYALAHFLERAEIAGPVAWYSGLRLLPQTLAGFVDIHALVPGFFSLTLAGVLLGLAYQRSGNLYFPIGIHAGWIFWLAVYNRTTLPAPQALSWLWGSGKMTDGWLAFLVLAIVLALFPLLPVGERRLQYTIPE